MTFQSHVKRMIAAIVGSMVGGFIFIEMFLPPIDPSTEFHTGMPVTATVTGILNEPLEFVLIAGTLLAVAAVIGLLQRQKNGGETA